MACLKNRFTFFHFFIKITYDGFEKSPLGPFYKMVPCFRRDDVWIPAFAGMTVLDSYKVKYPAAELRGI
jgi:hypothetical protein